MTFVCLIMIVRNSITYVCACVLEFGYRWTRKGACKHYLFLTITPSYSKPSEIQLQPEIQQRLRGPMRMAQICEAQDLNLCGD